MSLLDRVSRFIDDVLLLPDDLRFRLEDAEDALAAGEHARAAGLFESILIERPTLARAAVGLAQAREALGDSGGAREAIEHARALEPADPHVALFTARLALAAGDLGDAVTAARDAQRGLAIEGGEELAAACLVYARAERRRGRPDRAARELRKAIAARPEDLAARVELVEALVEAARPAAARAAAVGLANEEVDDASAVRLGLALHRAGAEHLAAPWLERGAAVGSDVALLLLGQRALEKGALDEAEQHVRRAVARGGGANALATLADVLLARERPREAADALATAASMRKGDAQRRERADGASVEDASAEAAELLRGAVRITPTDAPDDLVRHADALDALAPGDPAAFAARVWAEIESGRGEAARAMLAGDGAVPDGEPRVWLARARLAVDEGRGRDALGALDRWAGLVATVRGAVADRPLADSLRRAALRALWRGPNGDVDLAAAIDAVERFAKDHDLAEVERRAAALRDDLDRPLLLAILGEFNAGKSTFINAFVGADVAPTGILPTTATLNLLRSGAERKVRVVRADGTTREGSWDELRPLLKEASEAHVDRVEITLPVETLERVWILDTPGTNAIDPAHEKLAREAARRADAALWVFDAGQAGKGTEGKMLATLVESRRVVVPILNKTDRLREGQLEQVLEVLGDELPRAGLSTKVSAISAKQALRARLASDDAAYAASGFGELLARLETEIFSRSRELKRAACAGRLLDTLERALATEESAVRDHDDQVARLEAAAAPLAEAMPRLSDAVDDAIAELESELERAFDEAATEVLSFVRPRKTRFERHGADREDRAFLGDVLERRLAAAVNESGKRLSAKARGILAGATASLPMPRETLDARVRAAVQTPLAAHVGFQRGLLEGGALRRFFDDVLPRATLERDALAESLRPAGADPRLELRPALTDAMSDLIAGLDRERLTAITESQRARDALRAGVYEPLRALRSVLAELL